MQMLSLKPFVVSDEDDEENFNEVADLALTLDLGEDTSYILETYVWPKID